MSRVTVTDYDRINSSYLKITSSPFDLKYWRVSSSGRFVVARTKSPPHAPSDLMLPQYSGNSLLFTVGRPMISETSDSCWLTSDSNSCRVAAELMLSVRRETLSTEPLRPALD